ncbi:hypothetical protein G0Q06_06945 [Puniceicoccales bacterium CK1056]|uniref:Uncharacterized protein n=1 Tax=Oceanipulchritudo coccoides TaxID=2706888 RepID=A0A6B2M1U5_9BACT|nr:hypothetical protein [Oceanipulchritudo coccoides]NDV62179.1 hypothetical protein [Oceanipulchritudo coccoides]
MVNSRATLCCSLILLTAASGLASDYFPSITTPEWEESYFFTAEYVGDTYSQLENLRGANNAMQIIREFSGNTFLKQKSITQNAFFPGLPRTDTWIDNELTDEGLYFHGNKSVTYKTTSGHIADGVMSTIERVIWGRTLSGTTSNKVLQERQSKKIGEVTNHEYQTEQVATISATAMKIILGEGYSGEDRQTQTSLTTREVRSVIAGFDDIDGLYPGSNPVKVTPGYRALVRITETYSYGTMTTETIGGQFPGTATNDIDGITVTTIDWMVDGIGGIRTVLKFGAYLDDILNAPIFDKGDGVVVALDLKTLLGGEFDQEVLRSGGGNILLAKDAMAINGRVDLFGSASTPAPPIYSGFWDPNAGINGEWFRFDPLNGLIHIPRETQERPYKAWIWNHRTGWTTIHPRDDTSLNMYTPDQGWFWTKKEFLPFYFNFSTGRWVLEKEIPGR